jgi:HAMP domain-containing protein
MDRAHGLSVRLKLTLSYAGFLMLAGALLLAAVWVFLLRYIPDRALIVPSSTDLHGVFPIRSNLLHVLAPRAAAVLAFLLVFGLVGGWLLVGCMLAPLARITDATRMAATGSLSHRIRLPGRSDEFRELADAFDGDHADPSRRGPQRSKPRQRRTGRPRQRRTGRPPPLRQHPSDRHHRSTAWPRTSGSTDGCSPSCCVAQARA